MTASIVAAFVAGLVAALVWLGLELHHAHVHCIRGAHPAVVLEQCTKVQK